MDELQKKARAEIEYCEDEDLIRIKFSEPTEQMVLDLPAVESLIQGLLQVRAKVLARRDGEDRGKLVFR